MGVDSPDRLLHLPARLCGRGPTGEDHRTKHLGYMDEEQAALISNAAGQLATRAQVTSRLGFSLRSHPHGCMELDEFDAVSYRLVDRDSLWPPCTCSLRSGPTQCLYQVGQR